MEQNERWNQFAASGKVMDYLRYRESVTEGGTGQSDENEGSRVNGNNSNSNGNDIDGSSP